MSHLKVRRVVTGHDGQGNAVIASDATFLGKVLDGAAEMDLAWSTATFPSDNNEDTDGGQRNVGLVSPGGSVLQFVSMHPHSSSPHHRTQSLDYGIVLEGEIELERDNGATTRLHPGDVVIQRGTIHTWRNPTDRMSKMVFVLLDAEPVKVGDSELQPAL